MKPEPIEPGAPYCRHRVIAKPRIEGIPYSERRYRLGRVNGWCRRSTKRVVNVSIYKTDLILARKDINIADFVDVKTSKPLTAWLVGKLMES